MFHGSYKLDDVIFLMRVIDLEETPIKQKELLVKNKQYHYSELISPEYRPDKKYFELFYEAMKINADRVAENLLSLSKYYSELDKPVIVSLARAGTPVGVILKRMLARYFNKDIPHYSISIIKDRGIDESALLHILKKHPERNIAFLDGWVSKGSIANELKKSVSKFNKKYNITISCRLNVISDISGNAYATATNDDYLIPSAILNSVISGLISRSIYNSELAKDGGFHGCKYYQELANNDVSLWYVDQIISRADILIKKNIPSMVLGGNPSLHQKVKDYINCFMNDNNIYTDEILKLGIGESTRALLRRVPKLMLVNDLDQAEIQHILYLCKLRNVDVAISQEMPFKAMVVL